MQNTQPQIPLGQLWSSIRSWLFPVLKDEIGAFDAFARDGRPQQIHETLIKTH